LIVLVQLPIFVALFYLLGQAFELRDAGFLWMETLAEPDRLFPFGVDFPFFGSHFNLLPVLMTAANVISIKVSQPPVEKEGKGYKNTLFLFFVAIAFFLLFYSFPSGMVLYWTIANLLQLFHQAVAK
jgi:YidC/Oxa1 family membrane protein insertase